MIFTSLALLGGMALFSSAAPAPAAPVTHYVNVSNDTAGLLFDPPYIVSQCHYILTGVVLTHLSFRVLSREISSRSSTIPRTTV